MLQNRFCERDRKDVKFVPLELDSENQPYTQASTTAHKT